MSAKEIPKMKKTVILIFTAVLYMVLMSSPAAGMSPEARKSFQSFERKAEQGDPEAQYRLSAILERGFDSIPADTLRSLRLLRSSAQSGFAPAQNYLGYLYGRGDIIEANPDSARYWIRRAADGGDAKAAYNLAYIMLEDENREFADSASSVLKYLNLAANAGLPQAMTKLADIYAEGTIVAPDTLKAISLYEKSISVGFSDAQLRLLNMMGPMWRKLSSEESLKTALRYWRMGAYTIGTELALQVGPADPETARAYALLGHAYSHGKGVPYDHQRANEYFARAALLGNPSAQFILAETLEIFPDAISSILPELAEKEDTLFSFTPEDLRRAAANAGITTAEEAAKAITISYPDLSDKKE